MTTRTPRQRRKARARLQLRALLAVALLCLVAVVASVPLSWHGPAADVDAMTSIVIVGLLGAFMIVSAATGFRRRR